MVSFRVQHIVAGVRYQEHVASDHSVSGIRNQKVVTANIQSPFYTIKDFSPWIVLPIFRADLLNSPIL